MNHKSISLRKILADIQTTGITNFTLRIYILPLFLQEKRLMLALEQYYMLSEKPVNNTLYVAAGSPGGQRVAEANRLLNRKPIFMYLDNKLIFKFESLINGENSIANILNVSSNPLYRALKGDLFFKTFVLTYELLSHADNDNLLTLNAVQILFSQVRSELNLEKQKKPDPFPPVTFVRLLDNQSFDFPSFKEASV